MEFNGRVLEEAADERAPLLERVKFWSIFSSNLDEFFEVRVAGVKQQMEGRVAERGEDGLTPRQTFLAIQERTRELVEAQYRVWRRDLEPALGRAGVQIVEPDALTESELRWMETFYKEQVRPALTPLSVDPSHPFPELGNKSLYLVVRLSLETDARRLAVVQVPGGWPALAEVPSESAEPRRFVFFSRMIGRFLGDLFPGTVLHGCWEFRLTRNSDLYIDEEEVENLLHAVETQLQQRRRGGGVRLETEASCPQDIQRELLKNCGLTDADLYVVDGPVNPQRVMSVYGDPNLSHLRDEPMPSPVRVEFQKQRDAFAAIRAGDILLHHPYDSFESVIGFLEQAASDPNVLAVKQTLYRTGGDRRVIGALMQAARAGKQVTVLVELRARFDEANNIEWSRQLAAAGVHVVYGLAGFKVHAKMCLVVRKERNLIQRYLHLSTGNYNASTAKLYTDLGLFTCRADFCDDAANLFNLLTGVCRFPGMEALIVAPYDLHDRVIELIDRERSFAERGLPARIIAKMNSLVDPAAISALYAASQAGVRVDLIVRGVCCLRAGVPGLSENISVRSIVGRFLEHSRIVYFENGSRPEMYLGSADWMPRNFFRRIEVMFPIVDGRLAERIVSDILEPSLADNSSARELVDCRYQRLAPGRRQKARNHQRELIEDARRRSRPRQRSASPTERMRLRAAPASVRRRRRGGG